MTKHAGWLEKTSLKAKADLKAFLDKETMKSQGIITVAADMIEPAEELEKLAVWQRTSTSKFVSHVSPTGAAVLPKSLVADDELPRVKGWKTILKKIGKGSDGKVAALLRDVEFQHHQSTNGRWNDALNRYERWGVRSVDEWMSPPHLAENTISKRTFHRLKDKLVAKGLIVAESHLWLGKTHLWIKPSEEFSRVLFQPGYWEQVSDLYTPKPPARKPRGLSARHAELKAEHEALYKTATSYGFTSLSQKERWKIFETLTKPIPMGKNHVRKPFAAKGSHRYKRLVETLLP